MHCDGGPALCADSAQSRVSIWMPLFSLNRSYVSRTVVFYRVDLF